MNRTQISVTALIVIFPILAATAHFAAADDRPYGEKIKLAPADLTPGDSFGTSVALSADGSTALVGASGVPCPSGIFCGAAYVFVRTRQGWTQQDRFTAPAPDFADQFGHAVALSADGSTALISAPLDSSAYVFVRQGNNWILQQELAASNSTADSVFGASVALSAAGDVALIGDEERICGAGPSCGTAYIFVKSGGSWSEQQILNPSDPQAAQFFGRSAALSEAGDVALVGAPWTNCAAGIDCGAVYAFVREGGSWTQEAKLTTSDAEAFDHLGHSVALSGDGRKALVGASGKECAGVFVQCGAAYTFVRGAGAWSEESKLTVDDAPAHHEFEFGFSVGLSLAGDQAVIGSNCGTTLIGGFCGETVHVYEHQDGTWTRQQELTASDTGNEARFGYSAAIAGDGETIIVGNDLKPCDTVEGRCGAAYLFSIRIFSDGFESGDTAAWSAVTGGR
ncbi:MAG: hypothetical protein GY788_20275 [bacterium]|nr:hypothetical protein [bacterium]